MEFAEAGADHEGAGLARAVTTGRRGPGGSEARDQPLDLPEPARFGPDNGSGQAAGHGNRRSVWDAGWRFDHPTPGYR